MNNTYEVGCTPDDNNDRRLPGSVQPEPKRGNFAYGAENANPAKPTPLYPQDTTGAVGMPSIGGDYVPVPKKSASVIGPSGVVETTYDHTNRSAKFKYPNVHQDIPSKGRPNVAFNDHP